MRFFSEVTIFKEGNGNFAVDFIVFIDTVSAGKSLLVLHFDSYFGLGKLSFNVLIFCGNFIVFNRFSSNFSGC